MALEILEGFEHGLLSTAGGGIADAITGTIGTTIAIETTIKRTGDYSLKCAPTGSVAAHWRKNVTSRNQYSGRLYFYVSSLPSSTESLLLQMETSNGEDPSLSVTSSGTLRLWTATGGTLGTSPSFTTNAWHRLDWKFDVSANPYSILARIDGGTEFGTTQATAATNIIGVQIGNSAAEPAMTAYVDDIYVATTAAEYPIGEGEVRALRPDADGTHVNATNFQNDAAQAITGAGGSAFQYLDENPWTTGRSDYIQQPTSSSTDELRVTFPDSVAGVGIKGVRAWYALDSSATQAFATAVADIYSSTTRSDISGTADWSNNIWEARAANVTPNSSPWTKAQLDALEAELGHGTAQPATPRWAAVIIQYELTPSSGNLNPSSIASAEVFGTPTLLHGPVNIVATAIATGEAVGSHKLAATYNLLPTAIGPAEAVGNPTLLVGGVSVLPGAVASGEAFGTPTLLVGPVSIIVTSIASGEAVGSHTLIATTPPQIVQPTAIDTAESVGTPSLILANINIAPTAITSGEAVGAHTLKATSVVSPSAIATGEAVGSHTLKATASISPTAIPTGGAVGTPTLLSKANISPSSITSGETTGTPVLLPGNVNIIIGGIPSSEVVNIPNLQVPIAGQAINPTSISSGELFGLPTLIPGSVTIVSEGAASAEAFGFPVLAVGPVNIIVGGIPSAQAMGTPLLFIFNEGDSWGKVNRTPTWTTTKRRGWNEAYDSLVKTRKNEGNK